MPQILSSWSFGLLLFDFAFLCEGSTSDTLPIVLKTQT